MALLAASGSLGNLLVYPLRKCLEPQLLDDVAVGPVTEEAASRIPGGELSAGDLLPPLTRLDRRRVYSPSGCLLL